MNPSKSFAALALAVLILTSCSSAGADKREIRGTVEAVDATSRSIQLTEVGGDTSMLSSSGSAGAVRVYYDNATTVDFNGESYRPEDVERGDAVAVRVDELGNRLTAHSMTVLLDSSRVTKEDSNLSYGLTVLGTVAQVDATRQAIEIDRTSGPNVIVEYAMNTIVRYDNQTYRPADLERGDEVEVIYRNVENISSNRVMAEDITVTRNVGDDTFGGSTTQAATVRGIVRSIDTAGRKIEIESASWISNFNGGTTTATDFVIEYGSKTRVGVSGSFKPVSGLEHGDLIEVQVRNPSGSTLIAQRISLVSDVPR